MIFGMPALVYLIPCLIVFILWSISIFRRGKRELRYDDCVSKGTVALALVMPIVAITPIINIVASIFTIIILFCVYSDGVENFFSEPACFWRKK